MIYRREQRVKYVGMIAAQLSAILAKAWREEMPETRAYYAQLAEEAKTEHKIRYPTYKFTPARRGTTERSKTSHSQKDASVPNRIISNASNKSHTTEPTTTDPARLPLITKTSTSSSSSSSTSPSSSSSSSSSSTSSPLSLSSTTPPIVTTNQPRLQSQPLHIHATVPPLITHHPLQQPHQHQQVHQDIAGTTSTKNNVSVTTTATTHSAASTATTTTPLMTASPSLFFSSVQGHLRRPNQRRGPIKPVVRGTVSNSRTQPYIYPPTTTRSTTPQSPQQRYPQANSQLPHGHASPLYPVQPHQRQQPTIPTLDTINPCNNNNNNNKVMVPMGPPTTTRQQGSLDYGAHTHLQYLSNLDLLNIALPMSYDEKYMTQWISQASMLSTPLSPPVSPQASMPFAAPMPMPMTMPMSMPLGPLRSDQMLSDFTAMSGHPSATGTSWEDPAQLAFMTQQPRPQPQSSITTSPHLLNHGFSTLLGASSSSSLLNSETAVVAAAVTAAATCAAATNTSTTFVDAPPCSTSSATRIPTPVATATTTTPGGVTLPFLPPPTPVSPKAVVVVAVDVLIPQYESVATISRYGSVTSPVYLFILLV
ncbi:hypothetical protein BGZ94_000605 [Podila epigama]|nr:hypothetical protein BGZ94_000605 [Podila epigama]